MIKTSNFLAIARDLYTYLFFLVADKYWLASSQGREVSALLEDVFARDIGERAAVVQSFFEDRDRNHQLILSKDWPDEIARMLDGPSGPILLTISSDFMTFDPLRDDYALILLGNDLGEVIDNLRRLAKYVRNGEELFYVLKKTESVGSAWRRFVRASELKPGAFGFAVDLKQLIMSFGGAAPGRDIEVIASKSDGSKARKSRKPQS